MDRIIGERENERNAADRVKREYDIAVLREESDDSTTLAVQNDGIQEGKTQPVLKLALRAAALRRHPSVTGIRHEPCMADIERVGANLLSAAFAQGECSGERFLRQLMSGALAYQNQTQVPLCLVETDSAEFSADFLGRFGFQYIYDRPRYELNAETISAEMLERAAGGEIVFLEESGATLQAVTQDDALSLAHFVNARLCRQYGFFAIRSAAYYERVLKTLHSRGANLFQIMEGGVRKGCFAFGDESAGISEVVFDTVSERERYLLEGEQRKPAVMARIVNMPEMLKHISGNGKITIAIRIKDTVIAENDGLFIWYIDDGGSHMERVEQPDDETERDSSMRPEVTATIGELTAFIFGYMKLKQNVKFDSIYLAGPVWMNEKY